MDTTCVFKSEIKFFIKQTCLSIHMLKNMISLNVYDGRKCKIKKISHVSRRSNCRHEVFQRGLRLLTHLRIDHDLEYLYLKH